MTAKFKRILYATDFSEAAKPALVYACEFTQQFQAQLHILTVVQDVTLILPESGMMYTMPIPSVHESLEAAEQALKSILPAEWVAAQDIVLKARVGVPYAEIIGYALENKIDLIVMGTHGRSAISHVLLGSVAERVVRKSVCPVLTVRSELPI